MFTYLLICIIKVNFINLKSFLFVWQFTVFWQVSLKAFSEKNPDNMVTSIIKLLKLVKVVAQNLKVKLAVHNICCTVEPRLSWLFIYPETCLWTITFPQQKVTCIRICSYLDSDPGNGWLRCPDKWGSTVYADWPSLSNVTTNLEHKKSLNEH